MGFACLSQYQISALPEGQLQNPLGCSRLPPTQSQRCLWLELVLWGLTANPRGAQGEHQVFWPWVPACARVPRVSPAPRCDPCSDKAKEVEGSCPCGQDSSGSRRQRESRESVLPAGAACVRQPEPSRARAVPGSGDGGTACLADPVECPSDSITSTATRERPARAGSVLSCAHIAAMSADLTPSGTLRSRSVCSGGGMLSSWNAGYFQDLRKVACVPCIKQNLIFGRKFAF